MNRLFSRPYLLPLAGTFIVFIAKMLLVPSGYLIGGDDSGLYWLFPQQFMRHFSMVNTLEHAFGGYDIQDAYNRFSPFFLLITLLKWIPINTYVFVHSLNAAFAFISAYGLLTVLSDDNWRAGRIIKSLVAFGYVFSPYTALIGEQRLLSFILTSVVPATLYLFVRGYMSSNSLFVLFAALVISVFGNPLVNMPWLVASAVVFLPLLMVLALKEPVRFFRYGIIFIIASLSLNCYAYFNTIIQVIARMSDTYIGVYQSKGFLEGSVNAVRSVSNLFPVITSIYQDLDISKIAFPNIELILKASFWVFIVVAGIYSVSSDVQNRLRLRYVASIQSLLLAIALFQPNIGLWATEVFAWLVGHIPMFVMFRNMYGKFAHTVALQMAIAGYISYVVLRKRFPHLVLTWLFAGLMMVVGISNYHQLYVQGRGIRESQEVISGEFNPDFWGLVTWLRQANASSSYLYYPINQDPTRVYIEDRKRQGHYYVGTSPFFILSGANVYTGLYDFPDNYIPGIRNLIPKLCKERKYDELVSLLSSLDIRYILWDKQHVETKMPGLKEWAFGDTEFFNALDNDFIEHVFGKKLASFGERYAVYEIAGATNSATVAIASNLKDPLLATSALFKRISASEYSVHIASESGYLVLHKPFSPGWVLYEGNKRLETSHLRAYGHANAWELSHPDIKQSGSRELSIRYYPQKYSFVGALITVVSYMITVMLVIYLSIRRYMRPAIRMR